MKAEVILDKEKIKLKIKQILSKKKKKKKERYSEQPRGTFKWHKRPI